MTKKRGLKRFFSISLVIVMLATQVVDAGSVEKWTRGEYEKYKEQIVEGHKDNTNHYKVVQITKSVMAGYGTEATNKYIEGVDEYKFLYPMYVGLPQLSGNDYRFSSVGRDVDILKENTKEVNIDKQKEGLYRLNKGVELKDTVTREVLVEIEREYPRKEGLEDTRYLPYASAIAITEIQERIASPKYTRIIDKERVFIDRAGIGESKEQLKRHLKVIMSVTEHYGVVSDEEMSDILKYYIILWRESSPNDRERSLLNYTYGKGQNYSEEYKNKCIYGYSDIKGYTKKGKPESTGDIHLNGKIIKEPIFTHIMKNPELSDVSKRVEINREHGFIDALELYNVGITSLLAGQQTMQEIGGRVEYKKNEPIRRKQEAEKKAQEAKKKADERKKAEEIAAQEMRRKAQLQQVTRGRTVESQILKGKATQELMSTGGVYKPIQLIQEGREKRVDLTYYVQTHGEWAQERIRDEGSYKSTYSQGACGYTSMSMIIASINEDETHTPLTLKPTLQYNVSGGNIVVPHVGYSHGGMDWYINNIGLKKEVVTSMNGVGYGSGTVITRDNVRNLIDNGGVGIISTSKGSPYTSGGHMILLVGYTEDEEGNFENMILQDSNLISNLQGRFKTSFQHRINVNTETGLVYDNFMKKYTSVPRVQMRYASAVFIK